MNHSDPTAALTEMKRTEALQRDARSVLRRVDALAAIRAVRSLPRCGPPPSTWCRSWPIASTSNSAPRNRSHAACADWPEGWVRLLVGASD